MEIVKLSQLQYAPSYSTYSVDASKIGLEFAPLGFNVVEESTGRVYQMVKTIEEHDREGVLSAYAFRPACRSRDFTVVLFND